MAVDVTRLPQGLIIEEALTTPRPVGTIVRNPADGLLYASTNAAMAAYSAVSGTPALGNLIADPGDAAAIPVTASGSIVLTIGAGAETNTMAIPTALGQRIQILAGTTAAGSRDITCAQAINQAGNTIMTFQAQNDWIELVAMEIAGSALRWRVSANDGVTLS